MAIARIQSGRYAHGARWLAACLLPVIGWPAQADFGRGTVTVRGEVIQEGGAAPQDYLTVELAGPHLHRQPVHREAVLPGGEFTFHEVEPGQYELRVLNRRQDVIWRNIVSVHGVGDLLTIRLPKTPGSEPPAGVVSIARLRQRIPPGAEREFRRAWQVRSKGDTNTAVKHLEKAIQIAPTYIEAHNNLGICYLLLGDDGRAEAEFRVAAELDPDAALPQSNLSLVLLRQGHSADAEKAARRALGIDPTSRQADYVLGLALEAQSKAGAEALQRLRRTSGDFPDARLAAARILCRQGALREAVAELEAYIQTPRAPQRRVAEDWLVRLKARQTEAVSLENR